MRIGAILPHLLVFGGVRRYIELGNEFVSRGHEFVIFTPEGGPPGWLEFKGDMRKLESLSGFEHEALICGSPELLKYLDTGRAKLRIFYLQIDGVAGEGEIIRSGRYHVMANSGGLIRKIRKRYKVEPIDGRGGVNPALFYPRAGGGKDGTFRILCYGRLSRPRKGTRFVVAAVRWMYRKGLDVELQLFDTVNPGSPDPRIGFDPGVPYRYYLDLPQVQMASMYSAADVFVSAEHRAGWSNTAAEAAACGLPLVCTRSGTEDFAVNGLDALVIPYRNSFFLRKALLRLYRDRELARRMGVEAGRKILEFTWGRVCDRMERSISRLLAS